MDVRRLVKDRNGGVLLETTVMITIVFTFVLGSVDFLFAFYQWNAAAKAVEMGARIAAVSAPMTNGLNALSHAVLSSTVGRRRHAEFHRDLRRECRHRFRHLQLQRQL